MINNPISRTLMMLAAISLTACGGGGSDSGVTDSGIDGGGSVAGGGISGTGVGTITAFGSVVINDTRKFEFDDNTQFFRDGEPVTEDSFMQNGVGMVSRVEIGDDVSDDFTSGTAVTVTADNALKGPVTGTAPLTVLGQPVIATGSTLLDNVPGGTTANLQVGDIVEVSGYADSQNVIQATRIEYKVGGAPEWKLTGVVSNSVSNTSFQVGNQLVLLNGTLPRDCGASLDNGEFVEVKATQDSGFTAGSALDTVTDVECKVQGLSVPDDASSNILEAEIEGIVTSGTVNDFIVNGQRVTSDSLTEFEGGTSEDFAIGIKLEAEGDFDTSANILVADKIRFRETRVRIEAPVQVANAGLGDSFTILDIITVNTTILTEDDDGLLDGSGDNGSMQIEVRGYVDDSGSVIAEEVRERGAADPSDVRLRGPVGSISDPTFKILGVTVDTVTATSIFDDRVSPPESITPATFFSRVSEGTPVQVEDGSFNSATDTITGGVIEI
ncbi:MAG: DUF5666 domain-containing protein, partial [Chromatiales bacterium]